MRVFSAALATESNTFSPIAIDRRGFEASLYARPGTHPETPTLCSAVIPIGRKWAKDRQWTFIEGTAAWADPAGIINHQAFESLRDEILDQVKQALPLDAVALGLHGAMVAADYDDPEGDLLARVRELVGENCVICATFDPHSQLTQKRVDQLDFFMAFKEFPHIDFVDRAEDLYRILDATLSGEVKPEVSVFDCKMIDVFPTSREPMRSFVDKMFALEKSDDNILSLSLIHGFMASDVPEMGTKMVVVTDNQKQKGDQLARELGLDVFAMRGKCMPEQPDEVQAVADAVSTAKGAEKPVVLTDMWDNPGGGTAGDATVILEELMRVGATNVAVGTIWDPIAVQICFAAGEGAEIPLRFGAKSAPHTGNPIDKRVRVEKLVINAEHRFGDSYVPMGDIATISFDGFEVILNSTRCQSFGKSLFDVGGVDWAAKDILLIKSTNHFYDSFAPIAEKIIYCSAGRPYPNDPKTTDYQKAPKNIWPKVADPHNLG
ncbi:M81 family metallopeptidase [Maritalea mediterranea]|uniref:Microcystinase C n=1 Tax=Maritalea mediterranea TaxID=2909667 RepID=A0ABS9E8G2_9HYPH|nr:M81 family metallopeptidase [Maritalea mediterranea]MCF4097713.1 M81 family metallopeptidase [Maritalea mediterranea]